MSQFAEKYQTVRKKTIELCSPLQIEDYVVQPVEYVSPPKWHLGHTTWFYETFILLKHKKDYQEFHPLFAYLFNSYYETEGERVTRINRGNLTRPTVSEVLEYRKYVDRHMLEYFTTHQADPNLDYVINLGLNHEMQHQELLITDIKYILGHNPLFPEYDLIFPESGEPDPGVDPIKIPAGNYTIGFQEDGFCFDNELDPHTVWLDDFTISGNLITNREFLEFIESGGYEDFNHWHAEGWDWVQQNNMCSPLYWHNRGGEWHCYTLKGLIPLKEGDFLTHISFYEASAYASWRSMRLPTEFEWEVASAHFRWGERWEWTSSAYQAYPGYAKAPGAVGEYNGKFMVNQIVLRGGSVATPPGHTRSTYRNFFHPDERWQYTGLRLVEKN